MSSDSFGFGDCVAGTDRGWPCSEAAIGEDRLCRWHFKLAHRMTRRLELEDKPAPAPRKKAKP
jgi:hypothetical protein